jgi:DNA polymerase elongation subunit (family B)
LKPKELVFDIETSPLRIRTWGLREQDAIWVEEDWQLLSIAVKPKGGKTLFFGRNKYSERQLAKIIWRYFDEYDVLIGHNIKKFDIKKLNAKFIEYGLTPPKPYQVEDTLQMFRSVAAFSSNRLGFLAEKLLRRSKEDTGGHKLWKDCESRDPKIREKAFRQMEKYNKQDVDLNDELHDLIKPWVKTSPKLYFDKGRCSYCGSWELQSRGPAHKPNYQRVWCKPCRKWDTRKI